MPSPPVADRRIEVVVVADELVHERLRLARIARGLTIESMAKRSGVRAEWLHAIDSGRFNDLPAGIYARSAMRAYAAALNLNVNEILRLSAPLLPSVEDPIHAMRRLNGIAAAPGPAAHPVEKQSVTAPDWRVIAASAIDAGAMAVGLLVLVTCTVAMGLPMSVLDRTAAGPLFAVMLLVAGSYYVVFGGIVGQTIGEYVIAGGASAEPARLNLRAVATRTREAILRDSYFVERLGEWIGRSLSGHWHWPLANSTR
ncbi:MAG: helix-turn-helix domain-containing protein [Vicinamibacterales bacterium]